ncbi:unnamed protein product [Schistosoma margrebowiei]|uniref:Uncharacterized protein n=1 Tax=Schistosoma margrebowiei TaxID=48269 RepID=A0A183N1K3_9TREM|nr:unnamed protein product [Schistosoma margrebowiei]
MKKMSEEVQKIVDSWHTTRSGGNFLESINDEQGASDVSVNENTGKSQIVSIQSKNIWNSKQQSTNIKVRIFNTNVKTVLLYRVKTEGTTTIIMKKGQVFIKKCLCKMHHVH